MTNDNRQSFSPFKLWLGLAIAALLAIAAFFISRPSGESSKAVAPLASVEIANASLRSVAGGSDPSNAAFLRKDGLGPAANIYFASQIITDGDKLLFSEYYPRDFDAGKEDKTNSSIVYPRGGAIRTLTPAGQVKTVFLSKRLDGSKRPILGIVQDKQRIIFARGTAIWSMKRSNSKMTVLAGSLDQAGFKNGLGSRARFSLPVSFARNGNTLYISDRGNNAIRTLNLATGQVKTIAELTYEPQSILISSGRLWITGSGLASLALDCKQDCAPRNYNIGPQMISRAIARDPKGRLVIIGDQGFYRYSPDSNQSQKLSLPPSQGVPRATGAVYFKGRLYITDGSGMIQAMNYSS